jgi:hypothetical protein
LTTPTAGPAARALEERGVPEQRGVSPPDPMAAPPVIPPAIEAEARDAKDEEEAADEARRSRAISSKGIPVLTAAEDR